MIRFSLLLAVACLMATIAVVAQPIPATQCVSTAVAGGTPDAMTIPPLPCATTTTLLILTAMGVNAQPSPTLQVTGTSTKYPIVNIDLSPAGAGTIPGAGYRLLMTFDGKQWIILNTLNNVLFPIDQNAASFVGVGFSGSVANANTFILGSMGHPDTTQNPIMAIEKFAASPATSGVDTGLYITGIKTTNLGDTRFMGEYINVQDQLGWNGGPGGISFVEGLRSQATLSPTSTFGSAYGIVSLAQEAVGATHVYLIGHEAEIINNSLDAPSTFNPNRYSAAYVATTGRTNKLNDAAFLVNPFLADKTVGKPWRRGFYVPAAADPGVLTPAETAFEADCACVSGLDLRHMPTTTYASLRLPNTVPIKINNAALSTELNVIYTDSADAFFVGGDANISKVNVGWSTTPTNVMGAFRLAKVAVVSLPSCNTGIEGTLYAVTDAASTTFNAPIVSGGVNHVMAYCNGSSWTVH